MIDWLFQIMKRGEAPREVRETGIPVEFVGDVGPCQCEKCVSYRRRPVFDHRRGRWLAMSLAIFLLVPSVTYPSVPNLREPGLHRLMCEQTPRAFRKDAWWYWLDQHGNNSVRIWYLALGDNGIDWYWGMVSRYVGCPL